MTLELIVFTGAILFGILLYWRESNGNKAYRILNKIVNSKELQMKADDKTGFVYQQKFILRLVYVTAFFLIILLVMKFLIPINYTTISIFASCVVGTLIGTYVSAFVIKSGEVIETKSDGIEDLVSNTIEKGKEFIEDLGGDNAPEETENTVENSNQETTEETKKSARERLKDKGYLK